MLLYAWIFRLQILLATINPDAPKKHYELSTTNWLPTVVSNSGYLSRVSFE